jgi:hypothetical protein
MKTLKTSSGPFPERPYYETKEVEQICDDELHKVGLYPSKPGSIRIERFIEKRFKTSTRYENLPEGVLGYTKFGSKGVEEIVISRSLGEEGSKVSERRINTTLAHEAGHGLLHAHLFALEQSPRTLFGDGLDPREPKILCRQDTIEGMQTRRKISYGGRWWEYQANMAIGGLLLPRPLVKIVLEPFLMEKGRLGIKILDAAEKEKAAAELVEVFDVNPVVARIRIETMVSLNQENQLLL